MPCQSSSDRPNHILLRGIPTQCGYHLTADTYDRLVAERLDPQTVDAAALNDLAAQIDEYDQNGRLAITSCFADTQFVHFDYTTSYEQ